MAIYAVRMDHPDGEGWARHLMAHLRYLKALIDAGQLIASGPLKGETLRCGFLLLKADSLAEAERLVAGDPFAQEGLIVALRIEEWDPLFGALAAHAEGKVPAEVAALFAG